MYFCLVKSTSRNQMDCLLHIINIYSFTPITPFAAKTTAHQTSLIFIDASQVTQLTLLSTPNTSLIFTAL